MIAIVGAKGGCGKTTTALGLARAFGRADRPAVAVDADRQLPNLHVTAEVDREPTLEAVTGDGDVTDVAQPLADNPSVHVLPAPIGASSAEMDERLRALTTRSHEVVLDCPSGAKSALGGPLSVADTALVVTTETTESLAAAAKSVEIARQFDVSVAGTVLTKTDSVPTYYDRALEVPVLATIPDVENPVRDRAAHEAYDALVERLLGSDGHETSIEIESPNTSTGSPSRLETGIDVLDRKLDGGIRPGSIVACRGSAASQSERLLWELIDGRESVYLSAERSTDGVRRSLESASVAETTPRIRALEASGERSLREAADVLAALPDGGILVVDPIDRLERAGTDDYVEFLRTLETKLAEKRASAVVHCLDGGAASPNRWRTEHVADVVFELERSVSGSTLETTLSVPKRRGGDRPTETITLQFVDGVTVDTSRDIA